MNARTTASERVYAVLLYAYPAEFRRRFARDQRELFRDLVHGASSTPALGRLWARVLLDLIRTALIERAAALRTALIRGATTSAPHPARSGDGMFTTLMQDLRYSVRVLRKSPLFTATAVLMIALGSGAVTTIYSAANAILLRPIPGVERQAELVDIERPNADGQESSVSYPYVQAMRDNVRSLSGLVGWTVVQLTMGIGGAHVPAGGYIVTANYFDVLGVKPYMGRYFVPAEDSAAGAHPVVVVSYGFWQRQLGADPHVVGRVISIGAAPFTVIGVTPPNFEGTLPIVRMDAWVPMTMQAVVRPGEDLLTNHNAGWLQMFGRLRPGVSRGAAQEEMAAVSRRVAGALGDLRDSTRTAEVQLYALTVMPPEIRSAVLAFFGVLLAIAVLVLLIASLDVAGIMLVRGMARRREMAVRAALGARRRRLVAQLLVETLLAFGLGAAGGLIIAYWGTRLLERIQLPAEVPLNLHLTPDARVLAFALSTALATGLVFGLAPAMRATRTDLATVLRGDGARSGSRRSRARALLVVGQMAMSMLLLVAAGLFARALARGEHVDPGLDVTGVTTAALNVRIAGYDSAAGAGVFARIKDGLRAAPGVSAVAYAEILPLSMSAITQGITVDGYTPPGGRAESSIQVSMNVVDSDYFAAVGTPILRGRNFTATDGPSSPRVAIVNETFQRRYWSGRDAVGQTFRSDGAVFTVVGVMRDFKYRSLNEGPTPVMFFPFSQRWRAERELLVRSAGPPAAVAQSILHAVRAAGPNLPAPDVISFRTITGIVLLPQRVAAGVTGALGIVGLILAAVGLYGVIAFSMSLRTREIGIRIALGADRSRVLALVMSEGVRLVVIGILVGIALALVATRLMRPFLFGVSPVDPLTFGATTLGLLGVALVASYVPARRAAAADPANVLRQE